MLTCTLNVANRGLGVVDYERCHFRNFDRAFFDCLNKFCGGAMNYCCSIDVDKIVRNEQGKVMQFSEEHRYALCDKFEVVG